MSRLLLSWTTLCACIVLSLAKSLRHGVPPIVNERPVVGILSMPIPAVLNVSKVTQTTGVDFQSFIPASYVKFLEGAGARVIPMHWNASREDLERQMDQVNGILYTGGAAHLWEDNITDSIVFTPYAAVAKWMYERTLEKNRNGTYFPMWGTCLGLQMYLFLLSNDRTTIAHFDAENISLPLDFSETARNSKMFKHAPKEVVEIFSSLPVTFNNHHEGVSPDQFEKYPHMNFYHVLSTNVDRKGQRFISTIEARDFPIYAVQWHPEKTLYEHTKKQVIDHSRHAVLANQYMGQFFIDECSRNHQKFADPIEEKNALIYNYPPYYVHNAFEQLYLF